MGKPIKDDRTSGISGESSVVNPCYAAVMDTQPLQASISKSETPATITRREVAYPEPSPRNESYVNTYAFSLGGRAPGCDDPSGGLGAAIAIEFVHPKRMPGKGSLDSVVPLERSSGWKHIARERISVSPVIPESDLVLLVQTAPIQCEGPWYSTLSKR
ncbi:hypothetical protein BV22DRAFT_91989 [Leucogyrophana mollusca]|uniref:Uncharacterized protein n=1 Tax=Leucogyrophana mollusca TaxID=85980 RepID=A0ACB8BYK5_9AGAM|nr:hypothetical protein BV22DRAFT_91989 [Leucogyrophana mollusca]